MTYTLTLHKISFRTTMQETHMQSANHTSQFPSITFLSTEWSRIATHKCVRVPTIALINKKNIAITLTLWITYIYMLYNVMHLHLYICFYTLCKHFYAQNFAHETIWATNRPHFESWQLQTSHSEIFALSHCRRCRSNAYRVSVCFTNLYFQNIHALNNTRRTSLPYRSSPCDVWSGIDLLRLVQSSPASKRCCSHRW